MTFWTVEIIEVDGEAQKNNVHLFTAIVELPCALRMEEDTLTEAAQLHVELSAEETRQGRGWQGASGWSALAWLPLSQTYGGFVMRFVGPHRTSTSQLFQTTRLFYYYFIFYHDAVIVKLVGLFSIQFSLWKLYLPQSIYINDRFTDIHFFMSLIQRGKYVI